MACHLISAMFASLEDAERVLPVLMRELGLAHEDFYVDRRTGSETVSGDASDLTGIAGLGPLRSLYASDADYETYVAGLRRGRVIVSAMIPAREVERATDILERLGALDLDAEDEGSSDMAHDGIVPIADFRERLVEARSVSEQAAVRESGVDPVATTRDRPCRNDVDVRGERPVPRQRG